MNDRPDGAPRLSRRHAVAGVAAAAVLPLLPATASASPEEMNAVMRQVLGSAVPKAGRVTVRLPELTENGNSSPLDIEVASPMTDADHVRAIHVFSEQNPVPHMVRFDLGPRAGRAHVRTNIRLAGSQHIIVVAEMSDGSYWSGKAETIVTAPACIDESRLD